MIPVVLASDETYALPMCVAINSIIQNAHPNTQYAFHLLLSGSISGQSRNHIMALREAYPQHNFTVHNMADRYQSEFIYIRHTSYATYYRLQLPSLLPDTEKCLYLDVDICVNGDLTELFQTNIEEFYLAGVIAAGYLRPEERAQRALAELEIDSLHTYVNAGVLLMNLEKMRNEGLESVFEELLEKRYTSQDQDILNKACYGKILVLPPRYNAMTKYSLCSSHAYDEQECLQAAYSMEEWTAACHSPVIVHYADRKKPWNHFDIDYAYRWWNAARSLPFFETVYDRFAPAAIEYCSQKNPDEPTPAELLKRLKETYQEKSELNAKLQRTYQEKAERGNRIKELEKQNRELTKEKQKLETELNEIKSRKLYKLMSKI